MTKRCLTDENIVNLLKFREIVAAGLRCPTFEDKRRWLEVLRVEIEINNKIAMINCRLPIDPYIIDISIQKLNNEGGGGPSSSGGTRACEFGNSRNLRIKRQKNSFMKDR